VAEGGATSAGFSASATAAAGVVAPTSLGRLLRARADHLSLRGWW
jgi:hypothetical protein